MQNIFCCFRKKKKKEEPSSPPSNSPDRMVTTGPTIIIIGAGVAGLACAVKLMDSGIENIKILEAETRIGGRIHTVPFDDSILDLGAQFVHGETNNIVYEMVENLGLLESLSLNYVAFQCIRSNGEVVDENDVSQLKDIIVSVFENLRSKMSNFDGTFFEYLEDEFFDAMNHPKNVHINKAIAREFFENFARMESSESAVNLNEVSAKGFLEYWECEGDYLWGWKEKGFKEFLRVLTRANTDDSLGILNNKIILGARVQSISWDQDDGKVNVLCENRNEPFVADNVVVTVSLGVLKKFAKNMFIPSLPPLKIQAIRGLGFGHVFKVFIKFPHAFWPNSWKGFTTLWRKEDAHELRMNGLSCLQEIYGFYRVNYQTLVLEAMAVGPEVKRLEQFSQMELQMHLMSLLRRFLCDWNIPEPTHILPTLWSTNENFCGAYSFRTLQTETFATSASELAKPLETLLDMVIVSDGKSKARKDSLRSTLKPTVLFAGEATSAHYFSTVHGAVESGFREAKRLAGYYDSLI